MGAALFVLLIAAVAAVVVAYFVFGAGAVKSGKAGVVDPGGEELHQSHLRYVVPTGQDPAVLISALNRAGFTAAEDMSATAADRTIAVAEPADRERVREVLANSPESAIDTPVTQEPRVVRFVDEHRG